MPNTVKPGEKVKDSGIYQVPGQQGRTTLVKDKIAPPTPKPHQKWKEVVNTNKKK